MLCKLPLLLTPLLTYRIQRLYIGPVFLTEMGALRHSPSFLFKLPLLLTPLLLADITCQKRL